MNKCTYTSLAFMIVAAYALVSHLYLYALAWTCLSITSVLVHEFYTMYLADKIVLYIAIAIGGYYYVTRFRHSTPVLQIIPLVSFTMVVLLYFGLRESIDHAFVHLFSIVGHMAIILMVVHNRQLTGQKTAEIQAMA